MEQLQRRETIRVASSVSGSLIVVICPRLPVTGTSSWRTVAALCQRRSRQGHQRTAAPAGFFHARYRLLATC
jgi:hypothetical protein